MTDNTQPEALRLANEFKLCNEYDSIPSINDIAKAEAELRLQHARIAELEAQLEAIGAGGVGGPPLYAHHSPPEGMVGGWQDIATAPKDGTHLLLWEQYSTNPFVGCWAFGSWSVSHEHVDAEGGWDGAVVVDSISQDRITHWMKLPEAPNA